MQSAYISLFVLVSLSVRDSKACVQSVEFWRGIEESRPCIYHTELYWARVQLAELIRVGLIRICDVYAMSVAVRGLRNLGREVLGLLRLHSVCAIGNNEQSSNVYTAIQREL